MKKEEKTPEIDKGVKQEQIHDLVFGKEVGWQEIMYDLINTEQLNPWDIDISILANKYLRKIEELEEENYFVSSKVLLAAALLLRIKSEILLNKYIKSIDEILFGKKEEKSKKIETIELEEDIPDLYPRSPLPRFKKVTLKDLVDSLNKAIVTEGRRIQKEMTRHHAIRESSISLPKKRYIINDKIKEIYKKLLDNLGKSENKRVPFEELSGLNKDEKIISFHSLLHLENQNKIWIEQEDHFGDIHIWRKKEYIKENPEVFRINEEEISSKN